MSKKHYAKILTQAATKEEQQTMLAAAISFGAPILARALRLRALPTVLLVAGLGFAARAYMKHRASAVA